MQPKVVPRQWLGRELCELGRAMAVAVTANAGVGGERGALSGVAGSNRTGGLRRGAIVVVRVVRDMSVSAVPGPRGWRWDPFVVVIYSWRLLFCWQFCWQQFCWQQLVSCSGVS